jgi:hypothetical protein
MNGKRLLLGGLVAGVFVNISEAILNGGILMDEYEAMGETYGLTEASWAMVGYILGAWVLAFVVAWLYAAIRPRFGPGPITGVIAGSAVWVAGYGVPTIWFLALGLSYGAGATILSLLWTVVELALAGIIAGWLYREEASAG